MKKMWSEEKVNAAIAEYAATHPQGGKVYLHNIKIEMSNASVYIQIYTTSNIPFAHVSDIQQYYGVGAKIPINGTYNSTSKVGVLAYGEFKSGTLDIYGLQSDKETHASSILNIGLGNTQSVSDSVKEL